jgi:hypothetical protein
MPLAPLTIALSDGQKIETLKRFRARYGEELKKIELELTDALTAIAEADFLVAYLGEQPEVVELRSRKPEAEKLERRRQYLGMIIERLDQVIPQQPAVSVPAPTGVGGAGAKPGVRRY